MAIQVQYRRGTAAEWTSANPILAIGEPGYETDTGKFKVGNGSSAWASLSYSSGPAGPTGSTGADSTVPGPTGPTGPTGSAATVALGTVTTGSAGSSVAITNSGSSSAAVFDFTIPKGDTGLTGSTGPTGRGYAGVTGDASGDSISGVGFGPYMITCPNTGAFANGDYVKISINSSNYIQGTIANLTQDSGFDLTSDFEIGSGLLDPVTISLVGAKGATGATGSIGTAVLDDLSDTVIASPTTGQILRYNGTNWVNYGLTFTLGGNFTTSGANSLTLTTTGSTNITLPTTGILAALDSPIFTGTPTLPTGTVAATQIAGNSTTAVATTAFVTTAGDLKAPLSVTIHEKVASYTLVLTDNGKMIELNVATANTVTIPPNSSVAFPIGTQITVLQTNTGQTTVTPGAAVTVNATPGLKLRARWSSVTLIKRATDTWVAIGDLQA